MKNCINGENNDQPLTDAEKESLSSALVNKITEALGNKNAQDMPSFFVEKDFLKEVKSALTGILPADYHSTENKWVLSSETIPGLGNWTLISHGDEYTLDYTARDRNVNVAMEEGVSDFAITAVTPRIQKPLNTLTIRKDPKNTAMFFKIEDTKFLVINLGHLKPSGTFLSKSEIKNELLLAITGLDIDKYVFKYIEYGNAISDNKDIIVVAEEISKPYMLPKVVGSISVENFMAFLV